MIRNRFNYDKTLSENSNQELSKVQSPIGSQYSRTGCRICLFFIIPLLDTYEMTYDHFRQDADRIYMVRTNDEYTEGKISTRVPYSLAAYLAQHFPDIAVAAPFHLISERISVNDKYQDAVFSSADSAWMNLMDIRIIKGNRNFMLPKDNAEIAITEEAAKKWFRTEDPIGKEVKMLRRTKKNLCHCPS